MRWFDLQIPLGYIKVQVIWIFVVGENQFLMKWLLKILVYHVLEEEPLKVEKDSNKVFKINLIAFKVTNFTKEVVLSFYIKFDSNDWLHLLILWWLFKN